MGKPQIRFELVSPNHEFMASITGAADEQTATAVLQLDCIGAAWPDGDGKLYFNTAVGCAWLSVRPYVIDAIKRAKGWTGDVEVNGV